MARPRAGDEGFTLVEVMVAMGIFLVVSAATLGLIMTSLQTVRGNSDRVYAASLARQEVDALRTLGSAAIPLGASTRTVTGSGGGFTITRTATWVDAGAATNPCQVGAGVVPGQTYLRVRVDVVGGDLDAPQTLDAIVYPNDTAPTENTGTISVIVRDDLGAPVPGVTVTGSNGAGNTFQQVTGPDGCLFVPDLVAGPNWVVTINKAGYITEQPNGTSRSGVVVNELLNTALAFDYARPGSLTFTAGTAAFPVPGAMPFAFQPDTLTRAPTSFSSYPVTVTGLWPDQYTGWLRGCVASGEGSTATATLPAGGTATLDLGGARIELVGPPEQNVRAIPATPCTNDYPLGAWTVETNGPVTSLVPKGVTLPAGTWRLTSGGVARNILIAPTTGRCSVSWNVPGGVTQEEYDDLLADPDGGLTPEDLEALVIIPEVSDPCPPAP